MKTNGKKIILITQKDSEIDDPGSMKDMYSYGCESKIMQLLKLPDGTVKLLVEGVDRVKILECKNEKEKEYTSRICRNNVKDKIDSERGFIAICNWQ